MKNFRPGTARWLSSQGHPGYSPAFAQRVWAKQQDWPAASLHYIIAYLLDLGTLGR